MVQTVVVPATAKTRGANDANVLSQVNGAPAEPFRNSRCCNTDIPPSSSQPFVLSYSQPLSSSALNTLTQHLNLTFNAFPPAPCTVSNTQPKPLQPSQSQPLQHEHQPPQTVFPISVGLTPNSRPSLSSGQVVSASTLAAPTTAVICNSSVKASTETKTTSKSNSLSAFHVLEESKNHSSTVSVSVRKPCLVQECRENIAPSMWHSHMSRHAKGIFPGDVPITWLQEKRLYICHHCSELVALSHQSSHSRICTSSTSYPWASPGSQSNISNPSALPSDVLPSLEEVLSLKCATI